MKQFGTAAALALFTALTLGSAAGCAADGRRGTVGQAIDDATVSAGVKAAIVAEPRLEAAEIHVETEQGIVQLSGFVSSAEDVATAAAAARTVKGVRSVRNELRLK